MIQMADSTVKWVSEEEGKGALVAWGQGRPVILKNSLTGIAAHMISKITPFKEWIDEEQAAAAKERQYVCKYARRHKYDERCSCAELKNPPPLMLPEERKLLNLSGPAPEAPAALPEAPQTPEEKARGDAYLQRRSVLVSGMSMGGMPKKVEVTEKVINALPDCKDCGGKGFMVLPEHPNDPVTCVCITNRMFERK